jgi:hypothetical protein
MLLNPTRPWKLINKKLKLQIVTVRADEVQGTVYY